MRSSSSLVFLSLGGLLSGLLSGCSLSSTAAPSPVTGAALQGRVMGGQQPIVGAQVYLFAANTTGYGNASVSKMTSGTLDMSGTATNGDYYVSTDSNGNFSITGDYSCTPNTQVYLYALGGNPGGGANSAAGLLAALGNCPGGGNFATATPYVVVNEVSTVATAYAMAGFATDALHVSSSGTALAQTGIANAFLNATNLENISTGVAWATTPNYYGTPPQSEINTLANILAACVNSTATAPINATACSTLFANALSGGTTGAQPTDTATAAINIAHNPIANVAALYALSLPTPPFSPALTAQPNDFSVTIQFINGGGTIAADNAGDIWWAAGLVDKINSLGADQSGGTGYTGGGIYYPVAIALDLNENLWVVNYNSVTELSNSGVAISPAGGYTGLGITQPSSIAEDASGYAWIGDGYTQNVIQVSPSGGLSATYSGNGLSNPQGVAIDPSGNVWVADASNAIVELSSTGSPLSGASGYTGGGLDVPTGVAIDHTGDVWVTNDGTDSVTEISKTGSFLSGSSGYTGSSLTGAYAIAIDGSGNAWVAGESAITELSSTGTFLSGSNGFASTGSSGIAVDGSGDVWTNYYFYNFLFGETTEYTYEMIGAATPVVTPLVAGVKNNTLGTAP